jgi:hypothetical protein
LKKKLRGRKARRELTGCDVIGMAMFLNNPVIALRLLRDESAKSLQAWSAGKRKAAGESALEALEAWRFLKFSLNIDFDGICKVGEIFASKVLKHLDIPGLADPKSLFGRGETLREAAARHGVHVRKLRTILKKSGWTEEQHARKHADRKPQE